LDEGEVVSYLKFIGKSFLAVCVANVAYILNLDISGIKVERKLEMQFG